MAKRVLVAGIGNIFLADDGFGCEVVGRLHDLEELPDVRVLDYGIRGLHLAYDLLDDWDLVVLVDALPCGDEAGRVEVLEVRTGDPGARSVDAHGMDPVAVLASVAAMGGRLPRTYLVGAQAADVSDGIGLSDAMADAVGPAASAVRDLVREHLTLSHARDAERVS